MSAERARMPRSLSESVAERLRLLIVSARLAPGEKINERSICDRLGVSRTPVREAMRRLEAEGLVRITPRRGVRVAEITVQDLAESFPILGALEALAGELACKNVTEADLVRLRALQARMAGSHARGDLEDYFRLNEEIHRAIREVAGNARLIAMLESFSTGVRRARCMANLYFDRWAEAVGEHEEMLAALEARDGARLGRLMKAHLANKHAALAAALEAAAEVAEKAAE